MPSHAATLELKTEKANAHNGYVLSVDFDKDGGKIVSGGEDGTIKVWDSGARFSDIPKFEPLLTVSASQRSHSESADREDERPQRLDPVGSVFTGWEADRVRI